MFFIYRLDWQISLHGPIEAENPLDAIVAIRDTLNIKYFRGKLYRVNGDMMADVTPTKMERMPLYKKRRKRSYSGVSIARNHG